jgi:4'-phosphopantetheinyl transferase
VADFVLPNWEKDHCARNPILVNNEVHVWHVQTDHALAKLPVLWEILSPAERDRADRFKFADHRMRYIVAHAALRQILAGYLKLDPKRLEFREGAQGKPDLVLTSNQIALTFNLSHSHQAALVAVTLGRAIGVDIEYIKPDFDWDGIVENFFAPGEIARLKALPWDLQRNTFFTCWTRKESYIKAKGGGLSIPLDGFEVSVDSAEPAALLSCTNDPKEVARWSMASVDVGAEYAAALTVEGISGSLRCWAWDF